MTANPLSNVPPIGPASNVGPPTPPNRFKPVDPLKLLRQHLRTLIVAGILGLILGVGLWVVLRRYRPQFTSPAQLQVNPPPNPEHPLQLTTGEGGRDTLERYMQTQVKKLKFDSVMEGTIDQANVRNTLWFKQFDGDLRAAKSALKDEVFNASVGRGTNLILLKATTEHKEDAPELLSAIIKVYLNQMESNERHTNTELRQVALDRRESASNEVSRLTEDLTQFTRNNDLDTLNNRSSSARLEFESLAKQRLQLEYALSQSKASYQSLKASQRGNAEPPANLVEQVRATAEFQRRLQRLNQFQTALQSKLKSGYGPKHRSVEQLRNEIQATKTANKAALKTRIQQRLSGQVTQAAQTVENLKSQLSALTPKVNDARRRLSDLTAKLQQHEQIEKDLESARNERERAKEALAQIRQTSKHPNAVRVDVSAAPGEAELSSPKVQLIVPGVTVLVLGLVGGFLFIREMLDQRVRSPSDMKLISEATLLGMIPDTGEDPSKSVKIERIVKDQPAGLLAESYRQVRTAILSRMDRRGYKTLVLVSGRPGAGNSSTTYNLACSLALNGREVLVIDANFRRPTQHVLGNVDNDAGLAEVLQDSLDPAEAITPVDDLSLSILPAGQAPDAPPELLEAKAFRSMLGQLEADYDMVLIDAPPALLSSEAQLLAKQVDAIALIARAGRDHRGMIERMSSQLDGQRADILGIVLNGVRSAAGGYFRKSYQDFYRYRAQTKRLPKPDRASKGGKATKAGAKRANTDTVERDASLEALAAEDHAESTNGESTNGQSTHGQ